MKNIPILGPLLLTSLLALSAQAHDKSAPLNAEQKSFLSQYESVRAALAVDDLAATKKAAAAIATESKTPPTESLTPEQKERQASFVTTVKKIASAETLDAAREAFKALSKRAIHYAEGKEGYYVAHCPMVPNDEGNWVQTNREISNPYFGKSMARCGSIRE